VHKFVIGEPERKIVGGIRGRKWDAYRNYTDTGLKIFLCVSYGFLRTLSVARTVQNRKVELVNNKLQRLVKKLCMA
jgi:hypothetical protein